MKNFKKISPKRLKKLILNYQNLIKFYQEEIDFWKREDQNHIDLWTDQIKRNRKLINKYTIWLIITNLMLIIESIIYTIK